MELCRRTLRRRGRSVGRFGGRFLNTIANQAASKSFAGLPEGHNLLTSYLCSEDKSHQQDHRRKLAAQIVSDVADISAIPRLIDLLDDKDPQVRLHIARGLNRITGRDMGMTPEELIDATLQQRATLIEKWREWLLRRKKNRGLL